MSGLRAAIDIGTNSVLLTIAEQRGSELVAVRERATITRLGQGVDRDRRLAPEAIERTLACLAAYKRELDAHGVSALDVVGTSALRDAGGGAEFIARARSILGVAPRVLSGDEEAVLGFEGATLGIPLSGELTVFDVGGGSTEIVSGSIDERGVRIDARVSLDVGSVRLYERYVRCDPPAPSELAAIDAELARALAPVPHARADATLVGVAGTVTTLAALDAELADYAPERVHGSRLQRLAIERLALELSTATLAERRALPGMEPGRADVIVVGARIVLAIVDWAAAQQIVVSDRGLRWALIARGLQIPS